jgi:hypothetical protein
MAFTNYTSFVTTVENYLARTDLTSQIPDFIQMAQFRMTRDLRTERMLQVATADTTASNLFLAYYPDALLYATLAEAEPYLMNDQRIATWSALYDRAIANIKKSDLGATYPYTTLSVTPR